MDRYTLTISCEGYDIQTVVTVDESSGAPRITELLLRAADGKSVTEHEMPNIDLELLARAFQPKKRPVGGATVAPEREATGPAATEQRRPPEPKISPHAAADGGTPHPGKAAGDEPRDGAVVRGTTRAAKSRTAETIRHGDRSAGVEGARVYRRMPDDLAARYAEMGSVTALASHYNVPRYTVQGWIGRLRRSGSK